ncbi:MAG: F0F1 ATP synthase subunit A [Anaerolineae bacterium]
MEEVFPQVVWRPLGIPVRDTVISTWATMAIIIVIAWILRKTMPIALEMFIDFVRNMISDMIEGIDPDPYVPFIGTMILFLLLANNIGLAPIVQTPTKDINTPLALAIIVLFAVHVFGFRAKGVGYLKEQASPMLVLDVISQLSRTMSLSLRLFGNVIATEIIVAVIYRLVKPIAPLLLAVLGLVTGVLQAYIFAVLSTSAIAGAVRPKGNG